jgi:hypothetical protein
MAKDDIIALFGAILFLAGVTIVFGPGWALMTAGGICIYVGMRIEVKNEPNQTTDTEQS